MIHFLKQIINKIQKSSSSHSFLKCISLPFFWENSVFPSWLENHCRVFVFAGYVDVFSLVVLLLLLLGFHPPSQFPVLHRIVLPFRHLLWFVVLLHLGDLSFPDRMLHRGCQDSPDPPFDSVGRGVMAVVIAVKQLHHYRQHRQQQYHLLL